MFGSAVEAPVEEEYTAIVFHWDEKTLNWRCEQFEQLGFDPLVAAAIAASRADMQQARRLIASGCDHQTAREILL